MAQRGTPIYARYYAIDVVTQARVTGDAANHTLQWIKDATLATPANAGTVEHKDLGDGVYAVLLTAVETACDTGMLKGSSSTARVQIFGIEYTFESPDVNAAKLGGQTVTAAASVTVPAEIAAKSDVQGATYVLPVSATVSSGEVKGSSLVAYQNATHTYQFTCVDDCGNPIDLAGHTVKFFAAPRSSRNVPVISIEGSIGGDGHNVVTVVLDGSHTTTIQNLLYSLWDITADIPLATGSFSIQPIPQEA